MKTDVYSLELFIAKFLRYGVLLAGLLMMTGWLSQIDFSKDTFAQFHLYQDVRLVTVISGLLHEGRWGLLTSYAGMFVLICLPLLRVFMTLAVFIAKRDYLLAAVSGLVLLGLLLSVALGFEL